MLSKQTIGLRRVVVTGMGIVSCLGNSPAQVLQALRQGRSGIAFNPAYAQAGLRSHVSGRLEVDFQRIDRRHRRFMGDAAAYGYLAMADAIADARLTPEQVAATRTGCVMGSGGGSSEDIVEANQLLHSQGVRKVGPYRVPRTMTSTVSACLASCAEPVDYLNTHGTSTQAGDLVELQAALAAFDGELPPFSSTKSLSGHALGAAGVHEAIYALLMMRHGFMAASHNIEQLDPQVEGLPLVRSVREGQQVNCVMSNSFGFGGANASLVFSRRGLEAQGAY